MGRIFKTCLDCAREMDRELKVSGLSVPIKHYQNIKLLGKDQLTKEIIGVNFAIIKPTTLRDEMIRFMFQVPEKQPDGSARMIKNPTEFFEDPDTIIKYCQTELADRIADEAMNPGRSYKIRYDLWQKFFERDADVEKFDYTYSERISAFKQLPNIIKALKEDPHSRRAMLSIWDPELDSPEITGASTRVPCSISYQFLIRNGMLHAIYYIRSNDLYAHWAIDIWLTAGIMDYLKDQLKDSYRIYAQEYNDGIIEYNKRIEEHNRRNTEDTKVKRSRLKEDANGNVEELKLG